MFIYLKIYFLGTLLQKRKKNVKFCKEETLVVLRAYLSHPTKWTDILDEVKHNVHQLTPEAKELYQNGTVKQLRDRMSSKLGKLMSQDTESIQDLDIRSVVSQVKRLERRLVTRYPVVAPQPAVAPQPQPANQDVRDAAAAALSDSEEDNGTNEAANNIQRAPKAKKRPLADIIRQNQLAYNKFITKKIPKLLRQLGVSSDSSDEN